jgi:hypothetical protein
MNRSGSGSDRDRCAVGSAEPAMPGRMARWTVRHEEAGERSKR